jgi:hypothetical protein
MFQGLRRQLGQFNIVGLRDDNDARKAGKAHSGEGPNWAS